MQLSPYYDETSGTSTHQAIVKKRNAVVLRWNDCQNFVLTEDKDI